MLVLTLGLHWALLQTVAWTGMIISYSQENSLRGAVSMTFDGAHPCCLCKTIKQAKSEERQQSEQKLTSELKIKCVLPAELVLVYAPRAAAFPMVEILNFASFLPEPQTPPPRSNQAV